jgi:hypothetical protein
MLEGVLCFEYFYGTKRKLLLGALVNKVNRDLPVILMEK